MEDALAPSEMEVGEASAMTRSQQFADPLHTLDPWSQAAGQVPSPMSISAPTYIPGQAWASYARVRTDPFEHPRPQRAQPTSVYATATASVEPPAQRIIHDVPPVLDGKDPDNQAQPYLKVACRMVDDYEDDETAARYDDISLRPWRFEAVYQCVGRRNADVGRQRKQSA